MRYIGVSNFNVEQMKRAHEDCADHLSAAALLFAGPAMEAEILPFCKANNIGVINYSPMASGLLTGKMTAERIAKMPEDDWRRRAPQFNEPKLSRNLKLVELLREIGDVHGVQPGVVAIAWTLRNPAVTAAIVGARRAEPGGRNSSGGNVPVERGGSGADRCVYEGKSGVRARTGEQ